MQLTPVLLLCAQLTLFESQVLKNKTVLENNGTSSCKLCPRPLFNWQVKGVCQYVESAVAGPPLIDSFHVSVFISAGLREFPPVTEPTNGTDSSGRVPYAVLSGGFCQSPIFIDLLVASDTKSYDSVLSVGDFITIYFNEATNRGHLPQTGIKKSQIDNLLLFSCSIGSNYTASWIDLNTFQIEVLNISGNGGPRIGQFYVSTLASGDLRNFPSVCARVSQEQHLNFCFAPKILNISVI